MIVKASDDEARLLNRCLKSVSPYVDGIFITITGHNEACENVCKLYNANISHFKWINDFSAARNFNFNQVPSEFDYIMWCDADDVFRGLDTLAKTIFDNPSDVYALNYLYAFDENNSPVVVHLKSQIVKNDGCVEWVGMLHEDFKANRQVSSYFLKKVERLHLSDDKRFNDAKERNLEVASKQLKKFPQDPRGYWNVGNSLISLGRWEEAIKKFEKFLMLSESEEEKYLARIRTSDCYWNTGKFEQALNEVRFAIGIRPEYPDAYHQAGRLYFLLKQYKRASEMFLEGLNKKPPYHTIIVYNPRDYDYNPMLDLAKCFIKLERPDNALIMMKQCYKISKSDYLKNVITETESAVAQFNKSIKVLPELEKITDPVEFKKAYDKLDPDIKQYPPITVMRNKLLIKTESSGKDLVYYCGFTSKRWDGNSSDVGGSEEAVIHLTQLLADKGWNITVYNNCGHKDVQCGKVLYKPFWEFNYRDKQDVVILWRNPIAAGFDINCDNVCVDLHDVIPDGEFTKDRLKNISKVFVKSEFHKTLFPSIPEDKFVIIPNGIKPSIFEVTDQKDQYLMINTSSPDRSLSGLCDVFELVKKEIPEAKCKWAYGWGIFESANGTNPVKMEWKNNLVKRCEDLGIEMLGMINHAEVAQLYNHANLFVMPSEFAEIDCISLSKAFAAGAYPVTTTFSAMGEKNYNNDFIATEKNKDNWCVNSQFDFSAKGKDQLEQMAKIIIDKMKNPDYMSRVNNSKLAKEKFDWISIANLWDKKLN